MLLWGIMVSLSKSIMELTDVFQAYALEVVAYTHGSGSVSPPIAQIINFGLCHVFAKLVLLRHPEVRLVGSPTHVFLELDGLYYDSAHPAGIDSLTRYPLPLLDYSSTKKLTYEFPDYITALAAVSWLLQTSWKAQYIQLCREVRITN